MKKKIIIVIISLLVIALVVGTILLLKKDDNKVNESSEIAVVSTIIMDINPSIEIGLDKNEIVRSVKPLNDDAKEVITKDLIGKNLNDTIDEITEKVVEKGYAKDDKITILVSATGDIKIDKVESLVNESFQKQEITVSVLVQMISDSAKKVAEAYDISDAKASYIEEMLKENSELSIKDLKDKSINELEEIKNKSELKNDTIKDNSSSANPTPNVGASSGNSYANQPSDPTKDINAWCAYNKNGNPYGHEKPMMINDFELSNIARNYVMQKYNITSTEGFLNNGSTSFKEDNRSSYCVAVTATFVTRNWYKIIYLDSVTGKIIDEVTKNIPNLLTEIEARNIALAYYGLTADDAWDYANGEVRLSLENAGSEIENYRYSVALSLKNGEMHYVTMYATNGTIISAN